MLGSRSGCLLVKGEVYQRRDTGGYILSLGFISYVTMAVHLRATDCMGEARHGPSKQHSP